jgi:hypothetical protein
VTTTFSAISRYRKVPDVVAVDANGRATTSRDFRLLGPPEGTFAHSVSGTDRLDHLAFKYYEQPRDWWRILEANPAFLSPDSLLGTDRFAVTRFEVAWLGPGPIPPWSFLLDDLDGRTGVVGAATGTDEMPTPAVSVIDGPVSFVIAGALATDLDASTRSQQLTVALVAALAANGVTLSADIRIAKFEPAAWRIVDFADRSVRSFSVDPAAGAINVHLGAFRFDWILTIARNRELASPFDVLTAIESVGFVAGPPRDIHRIGKPIIIPPRTV